MTLLIDLRGGHFFICRFPLFALFQAIREISRLKMGNVHLQKRCQSLFIPLCPGLSDSLARSSLRFPDLFLGLLLHAPDCFLGVHLTCGFQASVTTDTIFQDTKKPLRLWFRAIWHLTSQKYGVNALGLQRVLGLGSYRTAWTWLHELRHSMVRPGRDRLSGTVDADETYLGGGKPGKRGRGAVGKVLLVVEHPVRELQDIVLTGVK